MAWIKVKYKLPPQCTEVLVTNDKDYYLTFMAKDNKWYSSINYRNINNWGIKYWQYLPEIPKGVNK